MSLLNFKGFLSGEENGIGLAGLKDDQSTC